MIPLPGLRGGDPLGFLAAVGLVALSEQERLPALQLSWAAGPSPVAAVSGSVGDVSELGEALVSAFRSWAEDPGVLPGAEPSLPRAVPGSTTDPMRMSPEAMTRLFVDAARREREEDDPWTARWLQALAAQTVTRKKGDVVLTPFYAPTGRMELRSSLYELVGAGVERVDGPSDALTRWRRTSSFAGANFDERAVRDAATSSRGSAANQGAPSPTWLAVMGIRMFPMVEQLGGARAVGWQRQSPKAEAYRSLVWPVWEEPLDAPAVRVLLASSALEVRLQRDARRMADPSGLRALGVTAVYRSNRRTLSQGDGPLGPAELLWSASS